MDWTIPLEQLSEADAPIVGNKAARLGAMLQAGLDVPSGFVVTADAFSRHFEHLSPNQVPERPQLMPSLVGAIAETFAHQFSASSPTVVVRSSAIGEDGATASFAGQHATYYYITKKNLHKAIVDCWMSLWNKEAVSYRAINSPFNQKFNQMDMAVIVQLMVQADRSGVAFGRDPTGQFKNHTLIEATWGLGAVLVDGRVSPDQAFVANDSQGDNHGQISHLKIAQKSVKVAEGLANPSQARLEPVPLHQQNSPVLSRAQILAVAKLTQDAEALFGTPQDVEWSFEQGQLKVLQSRNITGLNTEASVKGRWVLFKPVAENFSEPLTPLTIDLLGRLTPYIVRFIKGRAYINFDIAKRFFPLQVTDAQLVDIALLRDVSTAKLRINWLKLPMLAIVGAVGMLTTGIFWLRSASIDEKALSRFTKYCRSVSDDVSLNAEQALKRLSVGRHPFEPMYRLPLLLNVGAGRYFLLISQLTKLVRRHAPQFDPNKIEQLWTGSSELWSTKLIRDLLALAQTAKQHPEVVAALNGPQDNWLSSIDNLEANHHFAQAFEDYLNTYGHRGFQELELAAKRWREDPIALLRLMKTYLNENDNTDVDEHSTDTKQTSADLLATLTSEIGSPITRWYVTRLVSRIRYYVSLRENTRYYHTMIFATVREKISRIERTLIREDKVRCAGDIYFLQWSEILKLQNNEMQRLEAANLIAQRRRLNALWNQQAPQSSINIEHETAPSTASVKPNHLLGQCASMGSATGIARVIKSASEIATFEPGEILVAPHTDPAWTPLFAKARGVVVEVGSYLSHAGTVAREYQLPCLVDVYRCTDRIKNGQRLRLDATNGIVELIDELDDELIEEGRDNLKPSNQTAIDNKLATK